MLRGWEGNRRSGVALAMRHRLKWFIHLWAQRPRVGDEHPAYAPAGTWLLLSFTFILTRVQDYKSEFIFQHTGYCTMSREYLRLRLTPVCVCVFLCMSVCLRVSLYVRVVGQWYRCLVGKGRWSEGPVHV